MKIMTDMLLSRFLMKHPDCKAFESTKNIRTEGIRLLPGNPASITPGYAYVCTDLDSDLLLKLPEQVVIVYFTPEVSTQKLPESVIPIQSDLELADAFNALHTCFDEFIDWGRQLDFAIFRNTDFQELISLSEQMLLTPILVYDPAFKLLASSKKYTATEDPIFSNAVKNGFLDSDSVKYFTESHIFDEMAVTGSVIREPDEFRMHADFAKAISLNHEQAVFCVVLYQEHLPRNYVNGVFSILCDSFETLLKQQQKDFVKNRSVTDYFLMDLLDNPDTPAEQIKERLLYNDLDFDGYFLTISLHCELIQKQTESYFIQFLRNNMINCRIFAYHETIVILYHLPQSVSYRAHITNLFERLLLEYHTISMQLYVSKPYYQVSHFAAGYQQAENIAALLPDGQKKAAMHTVFFYEDHWLADFINQNPARDKTFFYGEAVLIDLMNKNTKKSKKQLQILMEYLNCGQNYTDVATHLGMHRNNVIYHIKSLSEAYHLNLEDSDVRLRLLLSYQIIKGDS